MDATWLPTNSVFLGTGNPIDRGPLGSQLAMLKSTAREASGSIPLKGTSYITASSITN